MSSTFELSMFDPASGHLHVCPNVRPAERDWNCSCIGALYVVAEELADSLHLCQQERMGGGEVG